MKTAIVIGRFNPFHPGHLKLIQKAFSENDQLIIGIGSTQDKRILPIRFAQGKTLPSFQSRAQKIKELLKTTTKQYQIIPLIDQSSPENWIKYLKKQLKLKDSDINTWYRADPMDENHRQEFLTAGIKIKILPRFIFEYKFNGKNYKLNSATEIRNLLV